MIMSNFRFRTEIDIKGDGSTITYSNRIMLLGSCFTTEIGKIMLDYKFDVMINPFGTLYNPASILTSLKRLSLRSPFVTADVIQTNPTDVAAVKKYASFYHHSSFARLSREEFLADANSELKKNAEWLDKSDTLIITLGTAWVFVNNATGNIVSNCHKRLAKEFTRKLLSVEECTQMLAEMAELLPDKKIIFTVSPIRHFKDGAHGNQISKATLLLAIDNIVEKYNRCCYFPSYEIMMDELRDYRYYAEDMIHPSPLAVKYIFDKFKESHISSAAFKQMDDNLRLTRAENHIQK